MKIIALGLILMSCLVACKAANEKDVITRFENGLAAAHEVQFYFVKVTDEPDYSVDVMKSKAGIKIVRQCGANCLRCMRGVVSHLKAARPMACERGDQNLLILVNGVPPVIYSRGGHLIEIEGRCFFNRESVDEIVERTEFIFG